MIALMLAMNNLQAPSHLPPTTTTVAIVFKQASYQLPQGIFVLFHSQQHNRSLGYPASYIGRLKSDHCWAQALLVIGSGGSILNPGPTKFPRGYCSKPVKSNQHAVCCDDCDIWYHVRCMSMSPEVYQALNNSYTSWICCACGLPNFASSLFSSHSSVSCSNSFGSLSSPLMSNITTDHILSSPVATSSPRSSSKQRRKHSKPPNIVIANLQGIRSKSAELEHLLRDEDNDIVIATETHLGPDVNNAEIVPPDFAVFRKDRNSSGGGVLIAVRTCFQAIPRPDLDTNCEIIWIELLTQGQSTFIGSFYRPPSADLSTIEALDESLQKTTQVAANRQIILGGDFNLPSIDWDKLTTKTPARDASQCTRMLDIARDYFLNQLVLDPTRVGTSSANILDLLFASKPDLVNDVKVSPGISDHHLVKAQLNRHARIGKRIYRQVFDFNKGNTEGYCEDMKCFADHFVNNNTSSQSIEEIWFDFKNAILSAAEKHFPTKTVGSGPKRNPWFNRNLGRFCRKKQRLFKSAKSSNSSAAWNKYKSHRKKTTREINKTRNDYVSNLLGENLQSNPKKFWSYIKSLKQDNVSIPPLKVNNQTITDSKSKANALNNYFKSVFTTDYTATQPPAETSPFPSIDNVTVTTPGIVKLINNLKPNKASGPDQVSVRLLKLVPDESAKILQVIFQQSLSTGTIPSDWKHAFVTPIHKKGTRSDPTNYRPISLTCISCKLLEHILSNHIMKHLDHHSLLSPLQHGFRKKHSCESQLIITIHDLAKALDNHHQTDLILLDFSKAFDSVSHRKLIQKCNYYGIRGQVLSWVNAFLSDRSQVTLVDGDFSDTCCVTSGVPQGSVLGPLLFLLFINDLPDGITSNIRLFADDCALYLQLQSNNAERLLQADLDKLSIWSNENHLRFNPTKCCTIHVTKMKKPSKFIYHLYGYPLAETDVHPYLGVHIKSDLRWNAHIDLVTKKASRILGLLRRNLYHCSPAVKSHAYLCLVRPILMYASPVWDPFTLRNVNKLEMVQRRAARFVFNKYSRHDSVTTLLTDLGWSSLTSLREQDRLCMMYKVLNNLTAINYNDYVTFSESVTRRRNDLKLNVFSPSINCFKYSFFPRTVTEWNVLSNSVVHSSSVSSFRAALSVRN